MIVVANVIVILFGVFLFGVGLLMLLNPTKARTYLRKAGSTNLINYGEITIRMIPAAALVIAASDALYPRVFTYLGWFMIATSVVLYAVPRKYHHAYAMNSADILTPPLLRIISPFSMVFGIALIYAVL